MKQFLTILLIFISFGLFAQKSVEMSHNVFVGNYIALQPIVEGNVDYPTRNRFIPAIGYSSNINWKFLTFNFGLEVQKDKILLIQDRLEFGINVFKFFKQDARQQLNVYPAAIRYNFQPYEINYYKQLSRFYKVEYSYNLIPNLYVNMFYEKDADFNFSKVEPTWEGRWDNVGLKIVYKFVK